MKPRHCCTLVYTIYVKYQLEILQDFDNRDRVKRFERVRIHLRGDALRHFDNLFRHCSIVLCRRVCQAISAINDCFLEAMVYWTDHFQFLPITASAALTPARIIASRAGSAARTR